MSLYIVLALLPFCLASLVVNVWLTFRLRRSRKEPTPSLEARDLLHDLTRRGQALVRVEVVDAAQLLLRSPRG